MAHERSVRRVVQLEAESVAAARLAGVHAGQRLAEQARRQQPAAQERAVEARDVAHGRDAVASAHANEGE